MNGVVFDAGGLIALERNNRRIFSILTVALEEGDRIVVPATALAQVIRNPAKQVRLWRMSNMTKPRSSLLMDRMLRPLARCSHKPERRTSLMLMLRYVHRRQASRSSRAIPST